MEIATGVAPSVFKKFTIAQDRCKEPISRASIILGAWADCRKAERILDVGTGSGILALMLAQRNEKATITAVEVDEESCCQARENIAASPWPDRVVLVQSDIQSFARREEQDYDVIVCHPPCKNSGNLCESASRRSLRSTKELPHGDLLNAFRSLLAEKGHAVVVLPYIDGLRFSELARSYGLYPIRILQLRDEDGGSIERLIIHLERKRIEPTRHDLVFYYEGGEPTRKYKKLTKNFVTAF